MTQRLELTVRKSSAADKAAQNSSAVNLYEVEGLEVFRDPQNHISLSILWEYPYLHGLHDTGVYMGHPYSNICLCAVLGPQVWRLYAIRASRGRGLGFSRGRCIAPGAKRGFSFQGFEGFGV